MLVIISMADLSTDEAYLPRIRQLTVNIALRKSATAVEKLPLTQSIYTRALKSEYASEQFQLLMFLTYLDGDVHCLMRSCFRQVLRLKSYGRISVKNRRFRSNGGGYPKFQVEKIAPTNHSSSQKTRLNDLSYDIKIWNDLSSILSQITRLTDGRTEFSSLDRVCIACSAVIIIRWHAEVFAD